MVHLLSKRAKYLAGTWLAAVIAAVIFYLALFGISGPDRQYIYRSVMEDIRTVEALLNEKNHRFRERGESIYKLYLDNNLQHSRLKSREALVIEQDGVIKDYFGEIYHFVYRRMDTGQWMLMEKNRDLYYSRKLADHVFYVCHFGSLDTEIPIERIEDAYGVSQLKFSDSPVKEHDNLYQYDENRGMFFYDHLLEQSNRQLILNLKFSRTDFLEHYHKEQVIFACALLFVLFAAAMVFYRHNLNILRSLWFAVLADLFILLTLAGNENLYIKFGFVWGPVRLYSVYQLLLILLMVISIFYFARKWFKHMAVAYILFNATLLGAVILSDAVFESVNFNYLAFGSDYLSLMGVICVIHLIPLLFIRTTAGDFYRMLNDKSLKRQVVLGAGYLALQTLAALIFHFRFDVHLVTLLLMSLISVILLFFKRNLMSRVLVIFLLAVTIYHLASLHSMREKKAFVRDNLQYIFLNQSNYAKFIAREIAYEFRKMGIDKFYQFFEGDTSTQLESIWRRTIASREEIASGIYVVDSGSKVLSRFTYQVPFLDIRVWTKNPFFVFGKTKAKFHGKDIPLAEASVHVSKMSTIGDSDIPPEDFSYDAEELGSIVIQVLNSPGLLLRYQDQFNIFTIDKKIDGSDFSYVRLNDRNQIVENPSNINLEDITGILKENDRWVSFQYMEATFTGYVFRNKDENDRVIIFFPEKTLFENISEVIKLFLLFALFFLVFYSKDLRKIEWRTFYFSFSIRVFFFLILISLLTAVMFSIFFINFSSESSEQKVMRVVYENGRIAKNFGYSLMEREKGFSEHHLLAIAETLNADVSVYEDGGLLETSNYRKIITSRIPEFLHSNILTLLDDNKQEFVLFEDDTGFHLYYKVYDYIFLVEFSNQWEKALSEEKYYTDFTITLFFILAIIGFSVAFFFRNKILSPIDGLNRGMAEVEKGNLPTLLNMPSEIEIKSLYMGFNAMIQGIREQKRSISELSRMKTIIRMGRRVAHEVKNPLTPIKLSAEQILRALGDKNPNYEDIIKQSVNYIIDETDHLKKVSYGFLDLSKMDEVDPETFNLLELVWEEMFNVNQIYTHIGFAVEVNGREVEMRDETSAMRVTLDKLKIKQVLKNLISNAIEAIGEKTGEIRICLESRQGRVQLVVADTGIGMNEKEYEMAFEVDYSTKDIGTGLGLFIVKRIVELHKGHIRIESAKHQGTRVILDLPESV